MLHCDTSLSSGARPQVLRMDGVYCDGIDTIHHSDAADAGSAGLPVRRWTASVRRAPRLCRLLADAPRGCHLKRRACSLTNRDLREPGAVHTSGISMTRCERRSCLKRSGVAERADMLSACAVVHFPASEELQQHEAIVQQLPHKITLFAYAPWQATAGSGDGRKRHYSTSIARLIRTQAQASDGRSVSA